MAGWHSMQSLMDVEGQFRILFAVICGSMAKCFGIAGCFTVWVANRQINRRCNRHDARPMINIVCLDRIGRSRLRRLLPKATGAYDAAIADVNDLKRSCVLGVSQGVDSDEVAKILIDNPFGNASQKDANRIIRNYRNK